jgi:hypothetical protein
MLLQFSLYVGLFWKAMPHRGYFFNGKQVHGVKEGKDRFTVILVTSMLGEIIRPMIVGKSVKLRSFPTKKSFYYESSPLAWVTTEILLKYLLMMNSKFKREERSVAVVLDNCPCHRVNSELLTHIKLYFLPPNTTSIGQPLDAGVKYFS